jgi:hypothetical protein
MFYKVSNGGTPLFKYICIFNDDTTQAYMTVLQILDSNSTVTQLVRRTTTSTMTFTANDGLRVSVTRNSQTNDAAKITPPSGKALRYIGFKNGSVGGLTTLAVNQTLSTSAPVFGNVVLIGYA